ncbi:MAG: S1C family serine protease [candidate division Zixibacteria bacterium]|nr:S1C family serine protease [candidate division Zixibacteria bacterium]
MVTCSKTTTAARFTLVILSAVFFAAGGVVAEASLDSLESGLTDLVYRLSRSVVTVEASRAISISRFGTHVGGTYEREIATGIVVDSSGLILVAARSVLGYDRLTVRYESRSVTAELVAIDYQTELALLRAEQPGGATPVMDRGHACAGQMVIALGSALGFRSSPALGFCAGMRDDGQVQFSIPSLGNWLGGGVFDLSGHLLGVIDEIAGADRALVAAVPASRIPGIVAQLVTNGDRLSGYAGITSQEIEMSPGIVLPQPSVIPASAGGTQEIIERGVVVTAVMLASPASRAGLLVGDLIFAVDHMPINSASGLASLVRQSPPGTSLQLDFIRQNQVYSLPLVVGRKSLSLGSQPAGGQGDNDQMHLADSLRQMIKIMRDQLDNLDSRVNSLDQD